MRTFRLRKGLRNVRSAPTSSLKAYTGLRRQLCYCQAGSEVYLATHTKRRAVTFAECRMQAALVSEFGVEIRIVGS